MQMARPGTVGLLVIQDQRLALLLAPQPDWQTRYGVRLLSLGLPSCACPADADCRALALALAPSCYGQEAIPLQSQWMYGPSARHAIDRVGATSDDPFLRFERVIPASDTAPAARETLVFAVYRARLAGSVALDARVASAVLWVSVTALRSLIGGERVADFVARADVIIQVAAGVSLPEDGLFFLPSDMGERSLARIAAKYGEGALLSAPASE